MWLAGFSCLFEILFLLLLLPRPSDLGFGMPPTEMSLWQKQQTNAEKRNEINFWFLFIIFSCFLAAPLTHEISGRIEAQRVYEAEIYVFTTKTIMDPLIGFLDCVLVSSYFFRTPRTRRRYEFRVRCRCPFMGECSMILTFRWMSFLVFVTRVHLLNSSSRVATPINRLDAHRSRLLGRTASFLPSCYCCARRE